MENETERDPLEVAADEAAQLMADWKASEKSWPDFLTSLHLVAEEAGRRDLLAMRIHSQFLSRDGQLPLIPGVAAVAAPEPRKPRAPSRRMMHTDVANPDVFECPVCHETEDVPAGASKSFRRRGIPCVTCCDGSESRQDAPGIAPGGNSTSGPSNSDLAS